MLTDLCKILTQIFVRFLQISARSLLAGLCEILTVLCKILKDLCRIKNLKLLNLTKSKNIFTKGYLKRPVHVIAGIILLNIQF